VTARQAAHVPLRPRISPLRYPGGKAGLYPKLRDLIRRNGLAGCTYIEPYAGGAGAALALLVTGQVRRIVINDLDPAIAAFWQTVVEEPAYIATRLRKAKLNVSEWQRQREIYAAADASDRAALGFATFYLNRTNRSGVLNGGPIGGLDQTGNYKIDARFNRDALCERIRIISLYARNIIVTSQDGVAVIRRYASLQRSFIYADPPYFEKAGTLYLNAFSDADHEALAKTLNSRAGRNWVLTYDNVPRVAELYSNRERHTFDLYYSAHRVMKAKEVMVLSDALTYE
jgi:DNA adenine methylase